MGRSGSFFNARHVNKFLQKRALRMDTIKTALVLVQENVFMTVVVQSQGYFAIPIAAAHRAFVSLQATVSAGKVFGFDFNALPMGPSLSTWAFPPHGRCVRPGQRGHRGQAQKGSRVSGVEQLSSCALPPATQFAPFGGRSPHTKSQAQPRSPPPLVAVLVARSFQGQPPR
jgi:hypothetical protein